jgi:uncharacterized membrane protein
MKRALTLAIAAFYFGAGLLHLAAPDAFLPIMPRFVPYPREVVLLTGLCEIAGAAGLLVPRLRAAAGLMLALYALCVWPANFVHAFQGVEIAGARLGWLYHAARLALQPALMAWALWAGGWLPRRRGDAVVSATGP